MSSIQLQSSSQDLQVTAQGVKVLMSLLSQDNVIYSEDCLTLNIWTKPQTGETKKAVLFWIYGGGYTSGTTDNKGYNGKYIADSEDVIVVSANYRVAIEWVRDNIAAFGGDPNRITLFGQSAGGSSVDHFSYAWTEDPIVAGFIAESGTVFTPGTPKSADSVAQTWYNITASLGCGNANSGNASGVLNCMKNLNWQTVQTASIKSQSGGLSSGFGPSVDNIVVFSDYANRSAKGNLIKRPLLIGSNNYEAGLFKVIYGLMNVTYPDAEWDFLQTSLFTCAISERALASVFNKVPTWRYRYFGNFPNLQLSTVPDSGAWHGIETSTIFGTDLDIQNVLGRTDAQEQIANYGLPNYHPLRSTLLRLAYNNQTGPNVAYPAKYDIGCVVDGPLIEAVVGLGLL
ncbi:putative carboxylesterase protein [Phaeoacremonium minimum UCRPA7]|uniref:Carboxylic ester hydrolase n=1 Tax=Phaeoacremonium minimum (strain UCR-PA7) TaxID=1286976 RepID=R8BRZ1_PHAM7|nr:putative carboxylesterase protein [Phaeoacremonium minimum UCRPA7]EOO02143.1 putative carboxylesterase protein [Phaeoacremonium minimum UCRPA7]